MLSKCCLTSCSLLYFFPLFSVLLVSFILTEGSILSFGYSVYRIHAVIVHFLYFSVGLNFPQGQYHELDVVFKTFDEFCAIVQRRGENRKPATSIHLKINICLMLFISHKD